MRFCWHCGGDADEPNHEARCDGRQGGLDDPTLKRSPADIKVDPKTNVRRKDPPTSHAAAYADRENRDTQRTKVHDALDVAMTDGLTDDEIQVAAGLDCLSSGGKRRGELMRDGVVVASGRTRKTRTGKHAIVWILKKYAVDVA